MNKVKLLLLVFTVYGFSTAQNTVNSSTVQGNAQNQQKYERNSISYVLVNIQQDLMNELAEAWPQLQTPDKYNNHTIESIRIVDAPYYNREDRKANGLELAKILNQKNIGREMIRKWFSQKSDGSFSMDLIKERGVYNATDADLKNALAAKRGRSALEDAGESLIKKSYVVVLDFKNIEKIADYYEKRKALAGAGLMMLGEMTGNKDIKGLGAATYAAKDINFRPGYRATIDAYVFKLNWTEEHSAFFYEFVWNNPKNLDTMSIPVSFLSVKQTVAENPGTEQKSIKDFMVELASRGAEFGLNVSTGSVDDFRVRTKIFKDKPIRAKIGLKEGVRPDQRYLLVETVKDEYGQPHDRTIGVLRASNKITDNRENTTGETEPTKFVQEAGKKPYPGLKMVQRNTANMALSLGYSKWIDNGYGARIEMGVSRIIPIRQLRVYFDMTMGMYESITYPIASRNVQSNYLTYGIGLTKEFFMTRNLHLEFSAGYMSIGKLGSAGFVGGIKLPLNIQRSIQLVPAVYYNNVKYDVTEFSSNSVMPIETSKEQTLNYEVMLRFKF